MAATKTNAALLDLSDRLGTLEAGKLADVLVVRGNAGRRTYGTSRTWMVVISNGRVAVQDGKVVIERHVPKPAAETAHVEGGDLISREIVGGMNAGHTILPRSFSVTTRRNFIGAAALAFPFINRGRFQLFAVVADAEYSARCRST